VARQWWRALWRSPLGGLYLDADIEGLRRLAWMRDVQARGEASATLVVEIGRLEDRFGLNPTARRRIDVTVTASAQRPEGSPRGERVMRLRAVDPAER
jgi:hypothetical protein